MPTLYCKLADGDFKSYGTVQEIIALCSCQSVTEKALPGHIIIHIGFFNQQDKLVFLQRASEQLPGIVWLRCV